MTVNRTTLLDLPLPVTGTESGTWGDTTNNGLTQYLDIAIAGTLVLSTDADVTLTSTEGDSSATNIGATTAQYAILRWTATGSTTRNITALAQSKTYVVINATGGTQSIVLRGAGPTTGVTIISGEKALCVWNGSDFVKVSSSAAAGGSNTQVQYNSSGVLAGSSNMTFNGTKLTVAGFLDSALTSGRVTYATTSGELTDSANLLYSGTDLTVYGITVGRGAGAVSTNTAVGASALAANTTGAYNTALGYQSLQANTTASNNTAVGYQAGYSQTTGGACTFVGYQAGYSSNAANASNQFFGYRAGKDITTGVSNTILGGYNGNQGGLDIRTANNYIVLSDGDGNPQISIPSNGSVQYQTSSGRGSFNWGNVSSYSQDLNSLLPNLGIGSSYGLSIELQVITQSSNTAASSYIIHGLRRGDGTWSFTNISALTSGGTTVTASGSSDTLTLTFGAGGQFGRCVVNAITQI